MQMCLSDCYVDNYSYVCTMVEEATKSWVGAYVLAELKWFSNTELSAKVCLTV